MTMKQEKKRIYLRAALALAALLVVLLALDNLSFVPSMLLTVLRKGAIYALVAVSMNLLNGFTGLFSLGQAGFMLLGAYTYAILTIPAASQKSIYQRYANGGIGFSIPELLSKPLGGFGLLLGVVFCLILAGFIAALFAFLIGLPVLKLKSDYLAIATLALPRSSVPPWFTRLWPADQRLQPSVRLYQLCQLQPFTGQCNSASGNRDALPLLRHLHRHHSAAHQLHLWPCLQSHP